MASFELIDPTGGATLPPGPWDARPAPPASFGAAAGPEVSAAIWRVSLPDDPEVARAELVAAAADLRAQEAALDAAVGRMGRAAAGGASFSSGQPAPERELMLVLHELRQPAGGASFGAGTPSEANRLEQARDQFQAFTAQVMDTIRNYAVVETNQAAVLIGRTSVGWTGDTRSLMIASISPAQRELHGRSLALALRSRIALIRTFGVVTRGAAIVASAVSSPAGPLLALPAAWKFVSQLLNDMRSAQRRPSRP